MILKVYPFKITKPSNSSLIYQEDSILFMDKTDSITQASKLFKLIKNRFNIKKDLELRMTSMFNNLIDVQKDIHSSIKS